VVGFTTGSRGKVPGKSCEKRIVNNNKNNNNNNPLVVTNEPRDVSKCIDLSFGFQVTAVDSIKKFIILESRVIWN
jgi:hypothetical protein